ncbi:ABC transporter ATP-binding protein [Bartonella sp. LJL80]
MGKKNVSETVAVKVSQLHKNYAALEVLKGVDFVAHEGDVVTMIGASGSGKSTLLRCINMLELPSSGTIEVLGETIKLQHKKDGYLHPVDKRQLERVRTRLSMVFQGFNLWQHMTVLQNVIEAPIHVLGMARHEAIDKAEQLLHRVGLYSHKNQYPAFLSGGQQQRVAIARALCMDPKVMLFDEPTSALDPELVGEVLNVIGELADEGRTMILVTHEMKFARDVSSKVIFLQKGKIAEEGTPDQVFYHAQNEACRQFVSRSLLH